MSWLYFGSTVSSREALNGSRVTLIVEKWVGWLGRKSIIDVVFCSKHKQTLIIAAQQIEAMQIKKVWENSYCGYQIPV